MQAGFDPVKAAVRLNWGIPETPEITAADLISAATAKLDLCRLFELKSFAKTRLRFWVGSSGMIRMPPRWLLQVQVTVNPDGNGGGL